MILQRIEKIGIAEKCEILERLKAFIAKKIAGSTLTSKPKRCLRCTSADLFCKGHSAQGHHGSVASAAGPSQRRRDRPQRYRSFSPPQGQSMQKTRLWACHLNQLMKSSHVSLKDLVGSMRMRLFEVMQAPLQSPRSAHVVCCQAEGLSLDESLAGSRARLAVQMRDGTQATAILCTQAIYQVSRSAQSAKRAGGANMQHFAGGPPSRS